MSPSLIKIFCSITSSAEWDVFSRHPQPSMTSVFISVKLLSSSTASIQYLEFTRLFHASLWLPPIKPDVLATWKHYHPPLHLLRHAHSYLDNSQLKHCLFWEVFFRSSQQTASLSSLQTTGGSTDWFPSLSPLLVRSLRGCLYFALYL